MKKNTIKIENLHVSFDNVQILQSINLTVSSNQPVCIVGEGSSGKTTLLKAIAGLVTYQKGNILINNFTSQTKEKEKNFYDDFGIMFQRDALFDSLTVWENVMFRELHDENETKLIKKSYDFLRMVDLTKDVAYLFPNELSGGMKKRVALARAVSSCPKFLLLDEPTAGLDPIKTNKIFSLITELCMDANMGVVTISSDIENALKYFKKIILLSNKKIYWEGSPSQMKNENDENVRKFL